MKADKQKVGRLLKTARGQIDGILKMIEEDQYCIDISNQVVAAQAVLRRANREILRAHIESCVSEAISGGDPQQAAKKVEELCSVLDKQM